MYPGDHELLLRTRRGDHAAAMDLWSGHAAAVRAYAISIVGRRAGSDLADDIVQCVFCRVLELPVARLSEVRDVPAWLMSVARNEALNQLRAMRRRGRPAPAARAEMPRGGDEALARAIERLARRHREVIVLRHVAGLSFDAMALATGLARSTVASRYASAVRVLQCELAGPSQSPAARRVEVHHA